MLGRDALLRVRDIELKHGRGARVPTYLDFVSTIWRTEFRTAGLCTVC
jgi:hypothetical protein